MTSHNCRSDRLTGGTAVVTILVTATVTAYLVKATVTATAMDTHMAYRAKKKRLGPQPPPHGRGGTCLL